MRRISSIVGGLVLAAGSLFVAAPPASAASYGCTGTQIDSYALKTSSGVTNGTVYLYYDSSTGKNCAAAVATSAGGYGTPTLKMVWLVKCRAGVTQGQTCESGDAYVQDPPSSSTKYTYYAGPVSVSAAGRCIAWGGSISSPSGDNAHHHSYASHCG
ncbi:hypothetical protein SAMN05428939_5429 [Streptomyces sp. TLI_105]|nr:hypothetical protein SAMN05428939_5429 [Streptomyces sp. TLI_105]